MRSGFPYPVSATPDTFVVTVNHVAGVAHKIQIGTSTDVSFIVVGNIIGGYPLVAGILLNQQTLLVQEIIGLPGCKAPVIQYLVMIHKHLCGLGGE